MVLFQKGDCIIMTINDNKDREAGYTLGCITLWICTSRNTYARVLCENVVFSISVDNNNTFICIALFENTQQTDKQEMHLGADQNFKGHIDKNIFLNENNPSTELVERFRMRVSLPLKHSCLWASCQLEPRWCHVFNQRSTVLVV